MKKLIILLVTLLASSSILTLINTVVFAQSSSTPQVFVNPNPPIPGRETTLSATNCPPGSEAVFGWTNNDTGNSALSSNPENFNGPSPVDGSGNASYTHNSGFQGTAEGDAPDGYTLSVTCGGLASEPITFIADYSTLENPTININPSTIYEGDPVTITVNCPVGTETFTFQHQYIDDGNAITLFQYNEESYSNNTFEMTFDREQSGENPHQIGAACFPSRLETDWIPIEILGAGGSSAEISVDQPLAPNTPFTVNMTGLEQGNCYYFKLLTSGGNAFFPNETGTIADCRNSDEGDNDRARDAGAFKASDSWGSSFNSSVETVHDPNRNESFTGLPPGNYKVELYEIIGSIDRERVSQDTFSFCTGDENTECEEGVIQQPPPPPPPCINDIEDTGRCSSVNTAFGPFSVEPEGFIRRLLGLLLSLSGGIAVLLIIFAGYKFTTSHGNPEAVQSARETLTSAIVGLLFIIFSLVILQVIGVDILRLPGFGA